MTLKTINDIATAVIFWMLVLSVVLWKLEDLAAWVLKKLGRPRPAGPKWPLREWLGRVRIVVLAVAAVAAVGSALLAGGFGVKEGDECGPGHRWMRVGTPLNSDLSCESVEALR